jgi:hypothetical protein
MDTSDITVAILRDIRDEIRTTNSRLDHLEGNLTTEILGLRGDFIATRELLIGRRDLQRRVEVCEREIVQIKERLDPT